MDECTPEFDLPGFRFHPTEEELLDFYLKNMISGKKLRFDIIGYLNIYQHDPWDLPGLARIGEREWYFFVPRDRRHGRGGRPNRITKNGFWKATGSDRKILSLSNPRKTIGLKKTLVFYKGRAPGGSKTDWVMNEYRLPDTNFSPKEMVLCKIYRKATSLKELEQRAAMEEEMKSIQPLINLPVSSPALTPTTETISFCSENDGSQSQHTILKKEHEPVEFEAEEYSSSNTSRRTNTRKTTTIQLPAGSGRDTLGELQLPNHYSMDWTQDSFWTQLRSPWFENWIPYATLLNF